MNVETRPSGDNAPHLYQVYTAELRVHATILVWLGYQRMESKAFAVAEEDDITGELVRQMKSVIEDESALPWIDHYSVTEQVRSDAAGKFGKRRPIVDIEFERHKRGQRPRFRFEAKRLGRGCGVGDYVGGEGLGAFLTGHYSRTHGEAGMLGYMQTGSGIFWAGKISAELRANAGRYQIADDGSWRKLDFSSAPPHCYLTEHFDEHKQPLFVVHILLQFNPHAG